MPLPADSCTVILGKKIPNSFLIAEILVPKANDLIVDLGYGPGIASIALHDSNEENTSQSSMMNSPSKGLDVPNVYFDHYISRLYQNLQDK